MGGMMAGPLSDYGAMAIVVAAMGVMAGLARAYLAHRTRLHAEREASARVEARANGLMRLAERRQGAVRIVEHDRDGHREVEFGNREQFLGGGSEGES